MKKVLLILLVAFVATTFASKASAVLMTGDRIKVTRTDPGTTSGGPFNLITVDRVSSPTKSYCIELGESIMLDSGRYYVKISNEADAGGTAPGVTGTNVPALATAMIFSDWLDDTLLTGISAGTAATNDAVQRAIWFLEGEQTWAQIGGDADAQALVNAYYDDGDAGNGIFDGAYAGANSALISGVGVAQLWQNYDPTTETFSGIRQDQLIRIPEPAAVAAWSVLGLIGLALIRRRNRK